MPGLTGFIATPSAPSLEEMTRSLRHDPRDTTGTWRDDPLDLGVGWVCHPGTFSDGGLVWNATRDLGLVFIGENFGTAASLPELLRGFETGGEKFFQELNGWFSGLLIDKRQNQITIFNDRFGLGRIYYHAPSSGGFYFGSEAKSLLRVIPSLRRLDAASLGEFFACGCALQNRTLFEGVSLLPPGSKWTFIPGAPVRRESYFDSGTWEQQSPLNSADFGEQLKATLTRVVPRYFRGPQPVGMSLTGGIDGRMIMAWGPQPAGALRCYSFNGPYRDCADVTIARTVAKACRQSHELIPVGDRFLADFPRLAEESVYLTDGTMDVTGAVELYVNRLAREIAPVRLTGNYGSEILRSNVAFRPGQLPGDLFSPAMNQLQREAAVVYATEAKGNRLSFIAFKQVPWHHYARLAVEQSQLTVRSPFLDNEIVALAYQAPAEFSAGPEPSMRLIGETNPALGRIPTDRGVMYPAGGGVTKLLRSIHEFLAKAEYAYDYGMPPAVAKVDRALRPLHLERLFLGRQKFYHFRVWYRERLASYLKEVLLDRRTLNRPYLNGPGLEAAVLAHTSGTNNYTVPIHKILTIELLQRQLLEAA